MEILTGIVALLFGLQVFVGQLISATNFKLAQKIGLQENPRGIGVLFSTLERNTAAWDVFVTWTLPISGVLILMDHSWWPYAALVAGGIYLDLGGRELVKWFGLRAQHVKTGSEKEFKTTQYFLVFASLFGLWMILLALIEVA